MSIMHSRRRKHKNKTQLDVMDQDCMNRKCDVFKWICPERLWDFDINDIHVHIYDHVMGTFIANVCCEIIKQYIGDYPKYTCDNKNYYTTLGFVFIDDHRKDIKLKNVCNIIRCDLSLSPYSTCFCCSHYEMWKKDYAFKCPDCGYMVNDDTLCLYCNLMNSAKLLFSSWFRT
jgi:hypothetical protein